MADPRIVQAMMARAGVSPVLSDPRQFPTPTPEQEALEDPLISPETYGAGSALRKGGALAGMTVFHGSPHRFPATDRNPLGEFDAAKIGTGEGAQAYGHGLYLAEDKKVGAGYSMAGADTSRKLDGIIPANPVEEYAIGRLNKELKYSNAPEGDLIQSLIDRTKREMRGANDPGFLSRENGIIAYLQKLKDGGAKATAPKGYLYEVDLPDEQIAKMLDWDAKLSVQPESVRAVTAALAERAAKSFPDIRGRDATGRGLYRALQEHQGWDAMGTSDAFMRAGVPGIKFLDAASRDTTGRGLYRALHDLPPWHEGGARKTSNFVVFPGAEHIPKIIGRK